MTHRSFNIKYRHSSNIKKNFNFNKERSILFIFILTIFFIAIKSEYNGNYPTIYLKVISNSPVPAPDQDEDENENHVGIHEVPEGIKILHICDPRPKEIYINSVLSHDFDNIDDCEYLYSDFNQIENNVTFVWYEPLNNLESLFDGCTEITEIIFQNFDTSIVTNMQNMFSDCNSIISLDLSSFITDNVENMAEMFYYCTKLLSYLTISNFDTSKVTNMQNMFSSCNSLTSLDLSNFNTVNVTKMNKMFYACSTLKSLDLSKFDTNKVSKMNYMFSYCSLLTYLNISHFTLPEFRNIKQMFYGCQNLIRLYLPNIDTSKISPLFFLVSSNILVKINEIDYLYDDLFQCTPYLCCLDYYNYTLKDYHINNNIHKCLEMSNQDICTLCGNNYEEIEINKDKNYTYCVDKDEKYISIDATSPEINMETTQLIVNTTQLILDTTIVKSTYFEIDTSGLIINTTQLIFNITENFENFIASTDINISELKRKA